MCAGFSAPLDISTIHMLVGLYVFQLLAANLVYDFKAFLGCPDIGLLVVWGGEVTGGECWTRVYPLAHSTV